jgi:hypothetical protein
MRELLGEGKTVAAVTTPSISATSQALRPSMLPRSLSPEAAQVPILNVHASYRFGGMQLTSSELTLLQAGFAVPAIDLNHTHVLIDSVHATQKGPQAAPPAVTLPVHKMLHGMPTWYDPIYLDIRLFAVSNIP